MIKKANTKVSGATFNNSGSMISSWLFLLLLCVATIFLSGCPGLIGDTAEFSGHTDVIIRNGLSQPILFVVEYENGKTLKYLCKPDHEATFGRKSVSILSEVIISDNKEILHLTDKDIADLIAKEATLRAEKKTMNIIWNFDGNRLHPMSYEEVQHLDFSGHGM